MSVYNENGINKAARSSSQRSVYDYPEHLNPFYEDENHKRLRFWKINANAENKKPGRSNSFSLDGLKGLWSFKTFRLKKKSSTLGINKTSESPPMLHRDSYASNSTMEPHTRHTVDIGLGNNFQRGGAYRSSLQDLNSSARLQQENFLIRHNRYRNTMQPAKAASPPRGFASPNRFNGNGGDVTPTLQAKFNRSGLSRGSSQTSVNSTNPFEDDYDDTISCRESFDGVSITQRSTRKKRRAPPPPPSSSSNVPNQTITTVRECSGETACATDNRDETVNITNLTAEIESFVKTADTDEENITARTCENENNVLKIEENGKSLTMTAKTTPVDIPIDDHEAERAKASRQSPESNDFYPEGEDSTENRDVSCESEKVTLEKIQNLGALGNIDLTNNNSERCKRSPIKILIRAPTGEETVDEVNATIETESDYGAKDTEQETVFVENPSVHLVNETEKVNESINKKIEISMAKQSNELNAEKEEADEAENQRKCANTTPTSTEVEFILESNSGDSQNKGGDLCTVSDLRITESTDDLTTITAYTIATEPFKSSSPIVSKKITATKETSTATKMPAPTLIKVTSSDVCTTKFEVRTIPLKKSSPEPATKTDRFVWNPVAEESCELRNNKAKKEPPTPPQRRRSVKEIIASINKCQSLLKINQDQKQNKTDTKITNFNSLQPTTSSTSPSMAIVSDKRSLVDRNINDSMVKQYHDKKMFSDIAEINNNINNNVHCENVAEELDNIPLFVERFNEFNNNNPNLFEKCVVRRHNRDSKTNGGKQHEQRDKPSNVEWNPVPKPRRHRNSAQGTIN